MADTPSVLQPGVIVGDTYKVESQLGRGGMGEVWLASHQRLPGKQVAIKVLHTGGQAVAAETQARFRREAEIAARLSHPNIVQVLDYNTLPSGQPYLVMELLKGEPLANRLRAGPLDVALARHLVRQVGSALQAAHAAGVVHRDLKPENIFLVPSALGEQVKVLDFGISKLADSGTIATTDSVLIGTPLYMSPEQALGHNREVGPQSDIFSLGSICYELLTGQAPFLAENIAKVVFRIAYAPHDALKTIRPDLPDDVVRAVEHALVKDRTQRTPDVATFVLEFTGQSLPSTTGPSLSESLPSIYTPGMRVSDSINEGATVAPSTGVRSVATNPPVPGPATPAPYVPGGPTRSPAAPPPSRAGLIIGVLLVVVAGAVGGGLYLVKRGSTSTAGGTGPSVTPVADAGAPAVTAPVDAGAPAAVVPVDAGAEADAGLEAKPDAGAVKPVKQPRRVEPPTDAEKKALAAIRAHMQAGEWDSLAQQHVQLMRDFSTDGGKIEGLLLMLEISCQRRDFTTTGTFMNKLDEFGPGARKRGIEACQKRWPEKIF